MTEHERVAREIGLAFDFLRYVIEKPSELEHLPDGAVLELVTTDRPLPPRHPNMPAATFVVDRRFRAVPSPA
jgi:hypothetical protein